MINHTPESELFTLTFHTLEFAIQDTVEHVTEQRHFRIFVKSQSLLSCLLLCMEIYRCGFGMNNSILFSLFHIEVKQLAKKHYIEAGSPV